MGPRVCWISSVLTGFFTQFSEFPEFRDFRLSWGASHSHGLAMSAHPRPGIASPSYCWGPPALPGIPGTRWTSSVRPRDGAGTVFRLPIRCFCFLALSVMDQGCCCQTAWHVSTKPRTGKAPSDHNGAAPKNERLIGTSDSTVTTKAEQISVRAASHCTHTSACKSGAGK